jgi:hypothetical protein
MSGSGAIHLLRTYSAGDMTSSSGADAAGGVIGNFGCHSPVGARTLTVERSYSTGNITGYKAGGLSGTIFTDQAGCTADIKNTYAQGNVVGANHSGGLIGDAYNNFGTFNVDQSYTRSLVSGAAPNIGGLFGEKHGTLGITNTFWLKDAGMNAGLNSDSGSNYNTVTYMKTVSELQTLATYAGWATFSTYWNNPGAGVYPTLKP